MISYLDTRQQFSRFRLLQIIGISLIGMLVAALVAEQAIVAFWISLPVFTSVIAFYLAYINKPTLAAGFFLWPLAIIMSILATRSTGIHDISILAYPGILVFAALYGNRTLLISLTIFIASYSLILVYLAIEGIIQTTSFDTTWNHAVHIVVIMVLTGLGIFLVTHDTQRMLKSLRKENKRVHDNQQALQRLAMEDSVTGLHNRIYSENAYPHLLDQCQAEKHQLAVVIINLDNFKTINDALGHQVGDILLHHVGQRLKTLTAEGTILSRFNADEFMLLMPVSDPYEEIEDWCQKALTEIKSPFSINQQRIDISASIGFSIAPEHGLELHQLVRQADTAMLLAKAAGRNAVRHYRSDLIKLQNTNFSLLQQLRDAIENQEFELYFQPKYQLKSGQIIGAEVLLRWPQADGSIIPPDQFIPLAERSGLIIELGNWVIERTFAQIAEWKQVIGQQIPVAINISAIQFRDDNLVSQLTEQAEKYHLDADKIELELTESLLLSDTFSVQKQLDTLNEKGFSFSIDDFGTGYSNLRHLQNFHASVLKIDRAFICNLSTSERDQSLVAAIVNMSRALGLETIAEGIEDEATRELLISLGCDQGQGYLWSPALPVHNFIQLYPA
ncbi:GGDEF-domain containing protein [Aliidiomarina minuta]|uniref:GGDEF-domain containing protein n=1 Tax=Aliidiomarina minuta TaxID=880057 RepID=A0A432W681_9GAMM|nr:EAL domain-containing protein [Aliidiomarina minuta]RUO25583.1 GGDEF-domain containing protein [Aliidiomarina minuta]